MNPITKTTSNPHYHIPYQPQHRQAIRNNNSRQINNVTFPVTFIQHHANQRSKDNSYINNINLSPLKERHNYARKKDIKNQDDSNKFQIALKKNNKLKKQNEEQITSNNLYTLRPHKTNNLNSRIFIQPAQNRISNFQNYNKTENDLRQYFSQGYEQEDCNNEIIINNKKSSSRGRQAKKFCSTHRQKIAQFKYIQKNQNTDVIDDGLYYCDICAMKLISKGFQLQKLQNYSQNQIQSRIVNENNNDFYSQYENKSDNLSSNNRKPIMSSRRRNDYQQQMGIQFPQDEQNFYSTNPHNANLYNNHNNSLSIPYQGISMKQSRLRCSKYTTNNFIQEAEMLANYIIQLKQKYEKLMDQSQNQKYNEHSIINQKDDESERQIQLIEKYYQKLIQIINQYKIKHVNKIKNKIREQRFNLTNINDQNSFLYKDDQQKNVYSAYKQKIKNNLHQLETMTQDLIFTDFDQVMEKLTQDDFKMCCDVYKNKVIVFVDDYQFIINQIKKLKWQQKQLQKNARKNMIKNKGKGNNIQNSKINVKQIQQTIDKIQKQIKLFYDPKLQKLSKRSSNSWHKFIAQFQKQSNARALQKPKSFDGKKQIKKENLFKIFQDQNKQNNEIISPQFKKI